jgi:hypothetical protein
MRLGEQAGEIGVGGNLVLVGIDLAEGLAEDAQQAFHQRYVGG